MKFIDRLYQTPNRLFYLAVFRVILALIVLDKALNALPFLYLLYDTNSFEKWHADNAFYYIPLSWMDHHYTVFYCVYIVFAIFMLVGYGRNLSVFVVYVCTDIIQNTNGFVLDGGDNLIKFLLLYLAFCNSFRYLVVRKDGPLPIWRQELSNIFTNLGVFLIIAHLLLVYFISGTSKAHSAVWFNGTALYYILNNDRFCSGWWNTYLSQNKYFVILGTYSTMLWEIAFPFLIWKKSLRLPLVGFGIMLHMGIFCLMMIHEFEIIFMSTYGFFFTDSEFMALGQRLAKVYKRYVKPRQSIMVSSSPLPDMQ